MNPIQTHIKSILQNYVKSKDENFEKHDIAILIRSVLPALIVKFLSLDEDKYRVYGSPGKGNWATVPWVAVLDREVTNSTENGYYIVYLFNADMSGFYLSLALGWTQYKNQFGVKLAKHQIQIDRDYIVSKLQSYRNNFTTQSIDLKSKNHLAVGYELGTILSKFYDAKTLPNDAELLTDLNSLLGIYNEAKGLNIELFVKRSDQKNFSHEIEIAASKSYTSELATKEIRRISENISKQPASIRQRTARYIARNRKFARLVKEKVHYKCEICGVEGFEQINGTPYAEAHHIFELASTRIDSPDQMICVCPTCHRVIHYGNDNELDKRKKLNPRNILKESAIMNNV